MMIIIFCYFDNLPLENCWYMDQGYYQCVFLFYLKYYFFYLSFQTFQLYLMRFAMVLQLWLSN